MKAKFILFVVLMLVLPLLAACGAEATPVAQPPAAAATDTPQAPAAAGPTDTPQAPAAAEPTNTTAAAQPATAPSGDKLTINLATWAGADESKELQAIIDKVNSSA